MQIIHKIDDFLFTIFPELKEADDNRRKKILEEYYTYESIKPEVSIKDGWVFINIDSSGIIEQTNDFKKVVELCEKEMFSQAKPILTGLIEKNQAHSEYHRFMGQILSEEGDQEEAINSLIDALRWDPKNGWALLMMGNIFWKYKKDIPTAMKYYDQALEVNPEDYITATNIAVTLLTENKVSDAKKYLSKAIQTNDKYPNAHYLAGVMAEKENELLPAFNSLLKSLKLSNKKDAFYQSVASHIFNLAEKCISDLDGKQIYLEFRSQLEQQGQKKIEIIGDDSIQTAAKLEVAESYSRDNHVILYKPDYNAVEHLIMHELAHLYFLLQARKKGENELFISTQQHKREFLKTITPTLKSLRKQGLDEETVTNYSSSLFDGMNTQVYNAPIDLFIEDYLFNDFPKLRPFQFLSLYSIMKVNIKAVTDKKSVSIHPEALISKSKVYNLVAAMQFKDLFGIDMINDLQATASESKQAQKFFDEFLEYRFDKAPAEEYELIANWAADLNLDKYFELVNEDEHFKKSSNFNSILSSIENDPLDLKSKDADKERKLKKFLEEQGSIGTNMSVVLYMVDALEYFKEMDKEQIKKIAIDIALQGTQGYSPSKEGYTISSIPKKTFSGYHILAYYYVSWAIAIPDMLNKLELPYEQEYLMAKRMSEMKE